MFFKKKTDLFLKFWGVRGSIPVPGKKFYKYGGNTSCVEVRCGNDIFALDAGTGIREMGNSLLKEFKEESVHINILITHTHWDHIQGFPFLPHIYIPGHHITFYGGHSISTLQKLIMVQMSEEFHPKTLYELASKVDFVQLTEKNFKIGDADIMFTHLMHPGLSLGYRITYRGKIITYITDNEILADKALFKYNWENIGQMLKNADIAIHDCQYSDSEYEDKVGWGHSSVKQVVDISKEFNVKTLYLFHHDPNHTDVQIDEMVKYARSISGKKLKVYAATEGNSFYI